tara:strand:- start:956 stop:1822 length:867 start_codon:yes stop_codon:yes gene_type:complete
MLRLITLTAIGMLFFTYGAMATEIIPYGTFNYKLSHDQNSSGTAYSKLENNGSKVGVEFIDLGVEGDTITGFAKLEVGLDVDDGGSNTFDSRLAYVGLENSGGAALSVGRQSHPFGNVNKTANFEVYGSNAIWKYADRSSNTAKFALGGLEAMTIVDGSTGEDGMDEWEVSYSHSLQGIDVAVGYADDVVNDISYWGAGASTNLGDLTIASTYTIKDAATDLSGMEATVGWKDVTVGYGDKEGTGVYYTVGLSHGVSDNLSVYAEYQHDDVNTGTDLDHYSVGTKLTF